MTDGTYADLDGGGKTDGGMRCAGWRGDGRGNVYGGEERVAGGSRAS